MELPGIYDGIYVYCFLICTCLFPNRDVENLWFSKALRPHRAEDANIANNIKVYTQDSKPTFDSNQHVGNVNLLKSTVANSTTNQVVTSFPVSENNTLFVDYSIKYGTAYAIGQLRVISDGTTAHFVDDRTETDPTSDVTFSVAINSGNLELRVTNAGSSNSATVSYTLKRWLTQ